MKKILFVFTVFLLISTILSGTSEARGRRGSHRVGGINSHGKGSHYVGGY